MLFVGLFTAIFLQWNIVGGEDPSIDELKAKMEQLQVQMRQVEETALERELLFEQIDRLVSRLESRKEEGKTPALELSRQLNAAQRFEALFSLCS